MGFDLLTKKRTGRDWSISIDGEGPTEPPGWLKTIQSPWVLLGGAGLFTAGLGIQTNKKPEMYIGTGLAALAAYKLVRKD